MATKQQKLNSVLNQLDDLKLANAQLKELKQAEMEHQRKYF